jgi:hypothetical protein
VRASEYPLPDYAISVWHRGDALALALPGHSEDGPPRTLFIPLERLPLDAPGWRSFVNLLAERRRTYQENERPLLSTAAEPTQLQLEEMCRAHFAKRAKDASIEDDIFATPTEEETESGRTTEA